MKALFIVLDTVRRDYLESYGNSWVKTPNLTKLAQRGVTFDNHWAGSLPCMPARREFMTGRYNFVYRGWGPIEPYDDVLPRWVRENRGTGQTVFSHLLTDHDHYFEMGGENYHTAFDTWEFFRGQEVDPWVSLVDAVEMPEQWNLERAKYRQTSQKNLKNRIKQQVEEEFSGPRTVMSAVQWLEDNKNATGDWLLQVELFDPHEPFYCTKKYLDMYGDEWDGPVYDWPLYDVVKEDPKAIEHIRKCYAGLLTMTDFWVGKLLTKLEEIGQFDDTTIIFTTDHGTMLGERGLWMKNYMPLYGEIAQIPLVIKPAGGARAGSRVSSFTQTIDIMPTFVDYFGATLPPHLHGQSLRPLAEGTASTGRRDGLLGYFGMATNVTDGRHMYMRMPVNADAGPLHAYTAMPVATLNKWFPRSVHERVEMGRYFGHTYNLPLYKIPLTGSIPRDATSSYLGRHQLFDLQADPRQENPIHAPALEAEFVDRLIAHLKACEAPEEQYTRLGLGSPKM